MFMLIYALCYLPGHIVPELLFRCVTLAASNRNFGFRSSRAGKFSLFPPPFAEFRIDDFLRARTVTRQIFTRRSFHSRIQNYLERRNEMMILFFFFELITSQYYYVVIFFCIFIRFDTSDIQLNIR